MTRHNQGVRTERNIQLEHALAYARQGWAVLPLAPPDPTKNAGGKAPLGDLVAHGFKDATADPERVKAWWRHCPEANVGVVTGATSGVIVIDVDPRDGGDETLAQLQAEHRRLPDTLTTRTGSGGWHYWFRSPASGMRTAKLGTGIDFKADGGYVVAPPSLHQSGATYQFEASSWTEQLPLPELPQWVIDRVGKAKRHGSRSSNSRSRTSPSAPHFVRYDPLKDCEDYLDPSTVKMIKADRCPGQYDSRSHRDFAVMVQLHHANLSHPEIKKVFLSHPIGKTLNDRKPDVSYYLDRSIEQAYPYRLMRDEHLPQTYEILRRIQRNHPEYRRRKTIPLSRKAHKNLLRHRVAIDEQTFRLLIQVLNAQGIRSARPGCKATYHLDRLNDLLTSLEDAQEAERWEIYPDNL